MPVSKIRKWNSAAHPRNPIGQFRKVSLSGVAHYTTRDGQIHDYYINNREALAMGSQTLSMAAHGRVLSDASGRPTDRIHVMGTDDGELLEVAASERGTFGLVNHDRTMPSETLTYSRGSKFEAIKGRVRKDEQKMGGTGTPAVGESGVYSTLDAQLAEKANYEAFSSENAKVYDIDPGEFGDRAADVRNWYEAKFGMGREEASNMELYAFVDGRTNTLHVTPAFTIDKNGIKRPRRSPNTHGGSPSVRLRGTDVTRMSRSMQDEGLGHVRFSISDGTRKTKSGKTAANALHFRQDFQNARTKESMTFWGSVEQHNRGVRVQKPKEATLSQKQRITAQNAAAQRVARKHWNPTTNQEATLLLRARHPRADIPSHRVHREKSGGVRLDFNGYSRHFDSHGEARGIEVKNEKGLHTLLKHQGSSASEADIARTPNGNFSVRVNHGGQSSESSTVYYNHHFKTIGWDDPDAATGDFSRPANAG